MVLVKFIVLNSFLGLCLNRVYVTYDPVGCGIAGLD